MNNYNISYFTDANTCYGYTGFLSGLLNESEKKFLFQHVPKSLKENLYNSIIKFCNESNISYHRIMQPGYSENICGLYFPGTSVLIFCIPFFENTPDGFSATEVCSPRSSEDNDKIRIYRTEYRQLKEKMYSHLYTAKIIHDDWEKIYISNMDFEKADKAADSFISEAFGNFANGKSAVNCDRFFGSMLPYGSVNYIDNITYGLEKRVFIKGRPGTGKSTFLKKIRNAALSCGFDTETYYCSFDPNSLDMVVIRDLSLCVFDSTSPHEMFPKSARDSIFDIYDIAVTAGTDEKYAKELEEIKIKYDIEMSKAKEYLANIISLEKKADAIYGKYLCFEVNISF